MGGWVKWEKDKEQEPGFKRLVRKVRNTCVTGALPPETLQSLSVTLTMGALLKFWSFADTYIRADDTLDMGPDDIDDLVGIPGFAAAMPTEWLRVIDAEHVELPAYQSHNGIEAKKTALAQKRMENKRTRDQRNDSVTPRAQARNGRVTGASPDQTRPDQTRPRPPSQSACADEVKSEVTDIGKQGEANAHVTQSGNGRQAPEPGSMDAIARIRAAYPVRAGRTDWDRAEHFCHVLIERHGQTWDSLEAAVKRYATYADATLATRTQHVMMPGNFFGASDKPWSQPWELPTTETESPVITWRPPPDDDEELPRANG